MTLNDKVNSVANLEKKLNFSPGALLDCMLHETGGTLDPRIRSRSSSAVGLIQFLEKTAVGLGTTTGQLSMMDFDEQLYYVEKYFQPYLARLNGSGDPFDIYMAIFYPAAIGRSDTYVMMAAGTNSYNANSSLDVNKDGSISKGEVRKRFINSVTLFRRMLGLGSPSAIITGGLDGSKVLIPLVIAVVLYSVLK